MANAAYATVTPLPGTGMPMTLGGPDGAWILGTLQRRRTERGLVHEQMRRIRDAYNGDMYVPLPEMGTDEQSSVANLIVTGVDQTAQRIASVMPMVNFPSRRPGYDVHDERGRDRTMVCGAWWDANRMAAKMRRRARWLVAYASAPVVIRPDFKRQIPCWETRDPLSTFPAPSQDPDDITPPDCIFTYFKSFGWLRDYYPVMGARLLNEMGRYTAAPNEQIELVEYVDAEVTVLGVLGFKQSGTQYGESRGLNTGVYLELERTATPGGMCPAVIPGRITLERPRGQFDAQIGMYTMQARLMALEIIAVERGIFPDQYLISRQSETAQFLTGPHDGRSGLVTIITGGDFRESTANPGFATTGTIDRLERAQRISGGIPAEYGGESPTNVRTGKRGDAVMAAITSYPVQEAQETRADALEQENRRAVAIARHVWGGRKLSVVSNFRGSAATIEYDPAETFDTDLNTVTYPMAGADANGLVVGLGQRVGIGMLSIRTAMELDPMVGNPEQESDRVIAEGLQKAVMASWEAQAQQGSIPPGDIARIAEIVTQNRGNLFEAIATAQKEAQARQASSGPPGTPEGPVAPGSPEAQPGLAAPGQGAEQPTIGPPPGGLQNMQGFLQALRGGGGQ